MRKEFSVCHNELILAVRTKKAVISVTVIECEPPLATTIMSDRLTNWQSSPTAYQEGIEQILHWIREGLAHRRRYRIFVDNLTQDRLSIRRSRLRRSGFVGRDWATTTFRPLACKRQPLSPAGDEPGSGKTALGLSFCGAIPATAPAYYFCNSQREETVDPRRFIRSLAAMLCGTVPAYRARLRSSEDLVRALKSDGQPSTTLWQGILEPPSATMMDGDATSWSTRSTRPSRLPPAERPYAAVVEAIPIFPQWLNSRRRLARMIVRRRSSSPPTMPARRIGR